MDSDETDRLHGDYRRARRAYVEAEAALAKVLTDIEAVAKCIRGGPNSPHGRMINPAFKPGISTWHERLPTREVLLEELASFTNAKDALLAARAAVPEGERGELQALPTVLRDL